MQTQQLLSINKTVVKVMSLVLPYFAWTSLNSSFQRTGPSVEKLATSMMNLKFVITKAS